MHVTANSLAAIAAMLLLGSPLRAQVLEWARCYQGGDVDTALGVAVDSAGYVYVTGGSVGAGTDFDYATVKYTPNGDTAWVRRFAGPENGHDVAWDLAVDGVGNVFVTGTSIAATIRYDADGTERWVRRFGVASGGRRMALDAASNVFVVGESGSDLMALSYEAEGGLRWGLTYDGPARSGARANDLALDSEGHVLVAGQSWGLISHGDGTQWNYATVKLDGATGDTLWSRHYNGPAAPSDVPTDIAFAVAVDDEDSIYVAGWSDGATSPAQCHTIKYGPEGGVVWERRFTGGGACYDILVAGGALYAVARGSEGDRLLKYDAAGDLEWVRLHAADVTFETNPPRLAADAEGNVYVMSVATGPTRQDYAVVKFTPAGVRVWTFVYPGTGTSTTNAAYGLAVDADANVNVTGKGTGRGWGGSDYLTVKISQEPVAAEPAPPHEVLELGLPFPNPFAGALTLDVSLGRPSPLRVEAFDALGRSVYAADLAPRPAGRSALTIDGSRWGSGIYQLRVTTPDGQAAMRRVVHVR